jgi:hypothetical protein
MLIKQPISSKGISATADREASDVRLGEDDEIFKKVLAAEHKAIAARRTLRNRTPIKEIDPTAKNGNHRPTYNTTGVALSGGGVRSAAFCLGVLQSLEAKELIGGLDYLSSVSGGGYIGASMTACMAQPTSSRQEFPFGAPREYEDREAVGHLRDYSNYLFPRGRNSLFDVMTVLLRGRTSEHDLHSVCRLSGSDATDHDFSASRDAGQAESHRTCLRGSVPMARLYDAAFVDRQGSGTFRYCRTIRIYLRAVLGDGIVPDTLGDFSLFCGGLGYHGKEHPQGA